MKHTVEELKLASGVQGLLIDVPDASVFNIELDFRAGDFLSPKGKWETAHILEHMGLGANRNYNRARLFQAEFQKNGAYMNASTGPHNLSYISECADFEWDRIVNLMKIGIEGPLLSEGEFKAEVGNVREELTGDLNNYFRQLVIRTRQQFGLVALDDSERLRQMENITVDDVRDFYKKTHSFQNLRFVIAGNLNKRKTKLQKIIESFDFQEGHRFELPDEHPESYTDVQYIERPGLENIYFLLGTYCRTSLTQSERDALNMLNTILTDTMHSRILGEARERGLAYDIASSTHEVKDNSGWWIGAEVMPQNALPVFEVIRRELVEILNGNLSDEELEAAKTYSLGRYQRGTQTVSSLASRYSARYLFNGSIHSYFDVPDRIRAMTKQDIISILQRMFKDNIWGLTIIGSNKDELAKTLHHEISVLWQK